MRIRRLVVKNIRSFEELEWRPPEPPGGWNVILGINGSGKSSLLRCLSLAIIGPREAFAVRQPWDKWLSRSDRNGEVLIEVIPDPDYDKFAEKGRTGKGKYLTAGVTLAREPDGTVRPEKTVGTKAPSPDRHIWGSGGGWFSAAYGPFRRFSGGDKDAERAYLSSYSLGAHISVFGENVALSESLLWLRDLNYSRLEGEQEEAALLTSLELFVNQPDFLPNGVRLKGVTSKGVEFEDANGSTVPVEDLGDGYRSILSMTFELIRQLNEYFTPERIFSPDNNKIIAPGVVMIDEVDAHLHPSWQKEVGFWLTRHFPRIQFIVTTHSPLVCHAASSGSIFLLPPPGSEVEARFAEGAELERLLYGDILDGLSTTAFGVPNTRSDEGYDLQKRLADLNLTELRQPLRASEKAEQQRLRQVFPTSSSILPLKRDDSSTWS